VRRLTKQIAQVKQAMREPPCFEGTLDPSYYLKWVQALEGRLIARGCLNKESFVMAIEKLEVVPYYWFRCLRNKRALQRNRSLKSCMDVRFDKRHIFMGAFSIGGLILGD